MTPTEYQSLKPAKTSKYKNQFWKVDGITFHSKREAARYGVLKMMERAGEIKDLQRQVKFDLKVKDIKICAYIADFVYLKKGFLVVEDNKGCRTPEYKIKAKLFAAIMGFEILET